MKLKRKIDEYLNRELHHPKQKKKVSEMQKKGWKIVMWDSDFVGMVDKNKNPAEVYPDGTVKYPKKRI